MYQRIVAIIAALAVSASASDLKDSLDLQSGDVIFYGGDSIESTNLYSHYIQAWFYLSYPELDLKVYHYGRSGSALAGWAPSLADTANGVAQGLCERYMYPFDPDVFILKMGGNGGQTAAEHKASYEYLISNWIDAFPGRKIMMLGQWSSQSATDSYNMQGKGDMEASIAATDPDYFSADVYDKLGPVWIANGNNAIDIQQPGVNPALSGGTRDSIHCGPAGHFVTAWATLQAMGAESLVSKATINSTSSTTTSATNCTISNLSLSPTGGTFDRLDTRLPWAYDVNGRVNGNLLASQYNLGDGTLQDWQDYSLTVTGLAEGIYEIKCDGVMIGSASNVQLAAGWNMAGLEVGPVFEQVQEVLGRIRDLQNMHRVTGADLGNPNTGTMGDFLDYSLGFYQQQKHRGSAYFDDMQPLVSAMDQKIEAIHTAARPLTRSYSLTKKSTTSGGGTEVVAPGRAWNYVGVPYPDWGYDPFTMPAPIRPAEWPGAQHAGYYYVEPGNPNATDSVNANDTVDSAGRRYGYPARPRLSLPTSNANTNTYTAGSVVWIKGGTWNTAYGSARTWSGEWQGTEQSPCWIYGDPTDPPVLVDVRLSLYNSTYTFVEGIVWGGGNVSENTCISINRNDKNGPSHHIAIRRNTVRDRAYLSHGSHFNVDAPVTGTGGVDANIHDVVFYRNIFTNNGTGVDFNAVDADVHGYKLNGQWGGNRAYRIWLIEDVVTPGTAVDPVDGFHKSLAGNYAQVGDQNVRQGNVDHVYIAGAKTEGMRQGCVGLKRCGHVVVSSNSCKNLLQTSTSQGQAFNVKYDRQENQWFVNNFVDHCDAFIIRAEATSSGSGGADTFSPADTRVYIIGNIFKDCLREPFNTPDAGGIGGWKTKGISIQEMRGKCYIANNLIDESVYGVYFGPFPNRQTVGSEMHVYNNLATRLEAAADTSTAANNAIMVTADSGTTKFYFENNLSDSGRFYISGTQYSSAVQFNARGNASGNLTGDPLFGNPATDDYSVKAGSPAIDAGTQSYTTNNSPDVYQLFVNAFTNDPDFPEAPSEVWPRDWTGAFRVMGAGIDIGPYEMTAQSPPPNPGEIIVSPTGLKATPPAGR